MPAAKTIEQKYRDIQDELLSIREYASTLENKNKKLQATLLSLKTKIKNLYHSLSN